MGDYRAHCKIELNGKVYESSLNWPADSVHPAVLEWLEQTWHEQSSEIWESINEAYLRQEQAAAERAERRLYEELKAKYEA